MRKGYARDLAGFWSAPRGSDAGDAQPRKPIELPRAVDHEPEVLENEPRKLDGVVRSGDVPTSEEVAIEKGRAKTMASMWQNRQDETRPRQAFRLELDVEELNAGVYENAPTTLDGVVRSTDQVRMNASEQQFLNALITGGLLLGELHKNRTVAIDDPVAWASVRQSVSLYLSRGFAVQTRLNGSTSFWEWRLSGSHFCINQLQEYYKVHSEVFVVIYYLVPLIYSNNYDMCCHKLQCHTASEDGQMHSK